MTQNKKCSIKFEVSPELPTLDTFESLLRDNGYLVLTEHEEEHRPKVHAYFNAKNQTDYSYHEAQLMWIVELVKNAYTF